MAFKAYKRDSKGRFAGSGSQKKQEARLAAVEKKGRQRGKDAVRLAQVAGSSSAMRSMARTTANKAANTTKTVAKAKNVYKRKRMLNK